MAKEEEILEEEELKPKGKKLYMLLGLLNIVALAASLVVVYMSSFPKEKVVKEDILMKEWQEVNSKAEEKRHLYSLVPFKAHLSGSPRRFVSLSLDLELLDEAAFEEVSDMGAQTRDAILEIINEKTVTDIRSVQGKLILKDEIITAVNGFLNQGIVKNAYFTNFSIQ